MEVTNISEAKAQLSALIEKVLPGQEVIVLVVENHLVFYVVKSRRVQIRRIIHGARKYDFLLYP